MKKVNFTLMYLIWLPIACAQTEPATGGADPVAVYQYDQSRQCQGGGIQPKQMARQLTRAAISVRGMACGHDGRMRIDRCGAGTGNINIFMIARDDLMAAEALGFQQMAQLANARRQTCPAPSGHSAE